MSMSKRMENLKKRLFEVEFHDPGTWHFKDTNILDTWPEITSEPMVVRKGYAQKYMGENLPAIIKPNELIVGNPNQNSVGWGTVMPKYYTAEEGALAASYQLNEASVWGHHPPQFWKILKVGVVGLKDEITQAIEKELCKESPDEMSLNNYKAMLVSLEGLVAFSKRHAEVALNMAYDCQDLQRKKELLSIYACCSNVPLNPARNFLEAVQSFWFTYAMINSGGEYIPLGRADTTLYPYYEADIKKGTLTKEEARDILASFLTKCNERVIQDTKKAENHYDFGLFSQGSIPDKESEKAGMNQTGGYLVRALTWQENESINSEANYNYGQSGNDWLMNCMVAGVNPDGTDATTDISYMFVEIMNDMQLLMPTLGARIHKNTPPEFVEKLADVLRYGRGEPMIYNDETIVPGFVDLGVPIEDARDYSNDGCWECLVQGQSHFSYAHIMNVRCLEWVLFQGESQHNHKLEGLDTGNPLEFKSFDEVYEAYVKQTNHYIDMQCQRRLDNFGLSYMIAPDPLMSTLIGDCIESGRDLSQDGAKYIFHCILLTGYSSILDSLMVIKDLVFEKKLITLEELILALRDNWEGHEKLRATVINHAPKYGNDDSDVDAIGCRLIKDFQDHVAKWNEKDLRIKFPCGIGTFENYAALGREIGPSPDGRYLGDALAPNFSPTPGVDKNGPTAVIKSATKPDLTKFFSGAPLDLSINSSDVSGESGLQRMTGIIKSFCELGGQIMTITSNNVEDLKDAQINPDKHRGLMVRMGGLSAYFIAMSPVQQENIIKRFNR